MTIAWALAGFLALLQIGDGLTTRAGLRNGGRELNPIIRWLISWLGVELALILKGIVGAAIGACMAFLKAPIALALLCALYCFVVGQNWLVVRRQKKNNAAP
ncbi:MAG: hypothetical protein KUG65_06110 [Sphingomonadaceae bacterium]|nr:hypothetical protein [Sphingomonadaceae bacterium]